MPRNPDAKRCGAKTRAGTPCQQWAMANGRCRLHGGKTPSGIALPQFKTGRYSKVIPTRLVENYQNSQKDEELLALKEEISLVDARIADVLGRVDTGEAGELWNQARSAYTDLSEAIQKKDADGINYALGSLGRLLGRGQADWAAWREVGSLLETRRKLVESERKRLVEMQQMLNAEQAIAYASALAMAVKNHVTDRDVLTRINDEFRRLLHRADQRPPA